MAEIRMAGLRELDAALQELPKRITTRVLWSGLMAGAGAIVRSAKSRAPVLRQPDPRRIAGNLRRNIRARPVRDPKHSATVVIGVRKLSVKQISTFKKKTGKGGSANSSDPFYWRFQEFQATGKPLQRFLKPAFDAEVVHAAELIKEKIRERIEIEANLLGKK